MYKKITVMVIVIYFAAFGISGAWAGFDLSSISNVTKSVCSSSNISQCRTSVVNNYLAASQELTQSQEKSAEAFGVKKEVLEKLAVVKSLKEGNINNNDLQKARKASEEANAIIKQKMNETQKPSIESKKLIAESIVHLANGSQKEKDLVMEVKNLADQAQAAVRTASPMEIWKAKDAVAIAATLSQNIPLDIKLTTDILCSYVKYAQANNITVPKNATCLLKGE